MLPINRQKGGALLTALFIMTLVAIVATAMSTRLQLDIYRTRLVINHDRLYLASQAVSFWALDELHNKNNLLNKANNKGMVATFPKQLESLSSPIKVSGGIYDLEARFNLNNLIDKAYLNPFMILVKAAYPDWNSDERSTIALAVRDWIMNYDLSRGKDNFMTYYLALKPPYYPSHQLMSSASELRLVKGVTAPAYLALEHYITALPELTKINLNTAPKKVLMTLGNGLTEAQANEVIDARNSNSFNELKDLGELVKKLDLPPAQIAVTSNYFLCIAQVKSDESRLVVYTLLKRIKDKNGKLSVSIVRESINSF